MVTVPSATDANKLTDILSLKSYVLVYYSAYKHDIDHKMTNIQLLIWRHVSATQ